MDNTVDNVEDKVGGQKPKKTTSKPRKSSSLKSDEKNAVNGFEKVNEKEADYIDSDGTNIEHSLTSILGVPTETVNTEEQTAESKADVLSGMGGSSSASTEEEPDFSQFEDLNAGADSPFFEDNELLAEIGVELIDMMMTYGAMAIAQDFDNEDKYAIKDKRKKRLKEPLAKILENREIKTAPELVFAFMIVASYSPIMIMAVQERRKKKNVKKGNPAQSSQAVVTPAKMDVLNDDSLSVEPTPKKEIEQPEDDDAMAEMLSKMKSKRKSGRPVGGTDLKPRKALSEEDRDKEIQKAKALRKDGWSFSRIAKELNVSEGTATRWVRS